MAGNWKMFKTAGDTRSYFHKFKSLIGTQTKCEVVICPPFPNLSAATEESKGTEIQIGAQNLYWAKEGAFTGEVSAAMIQALGCSYVIIGHSERRQYFQESDADVLRKTQAALEYGLTPIVCVGENLDQRESGTTEQVLMEQFEGSLGELSTGQFGKIVIAYEPVWAIGTGKTATPDIAQDAHRILRREAAARFGADAAGAIRILYGGSVKPDNVTKLMSEEDIDGALVGGASLDPDSFAKIVQY